MGAVIVGVYPEAHQKQPGTLMVASPPQPMPQYMQRGNVGPIYPAVQLHNRVGGVTGYKGQRVLGPKTRAEQGEGKNCWYLHKQCIRGSSDLCLQLICCSPCPIISKNLHRPPYFRTASLWGKGPSAGREENIHIKKTEPAQT